MTEVRNTVWAIQDIHGTFQKTQVWCLKEKYQNVVLSGNYEHRDVMMSIMIVICGNIEIECVFAINSLANSPKPPGKS